MKNRLISYFIGYDHFRPIFVTHDLKERRYGKFRKLQKKLREMGMGFQEDENTGQIEIKDSNPRNSVLNNMSASEEGHRKFHNSIYSYPQAWTAQQEVKIRNEHIDAMKRDEMRRLERRAEEERRRVERNRLMAQAQIRSSTTTLGNISGGGLPTGNIPGFMGLKHTGGINPYNLPFREVMPDWMYNVLDKGVTHYYKKVPCPGLGVDDVDVEVQERVYNEVEYPVLFVGVPNAYITPSSYVFKLAGDSDLDKIDWEAEKGVLHIKVGKLEQCDEGKSF